MIREAILGAASRSDRERRIGGTTVLERQLFVLARAGLRRVWIEGEVPPEFRSPLELELHEAARGVRPPGSSLRVSGDRFFRIDAVRSAARGGRDIDGGIELAQPDDKILDWLMEGLRKSSDGFMARWFDRRISMAVTRRLLNTPVRPNHMTIFSTLIGLAGGVLFFFAIRKLELLGAFLIWLHTVLDGCDGELARLTFRESSWGAWLDFWGDNVVHIALFAGLTIGQLHRYRWAPLLGLLACVGTLGSAIGSAWLSARNKVPGETVPALNPGIRGMANIKTDRQGFLANLKKLEVALAQRDFIYLLLLCTLIDRLEEFLWAAACGAPLYLFILIYLVRHQNGRTAPKSHVESSQAEMVKEPV